MSTTLALRDRVAAYFKSHPREWISMQDLAAIGGTGGWRTRVSDCRLQLGMPIENLTKRGQGRTYSYYRYVPAVEPQQVDVLGRSA